jgi:hypothetical protein
VKFKLVKLIIDNKFSEEQHYLNAINSFKNRDVSTLQINDIDNLINFLKVWMKVRRIKYEDQEIRNRIYQDIKRCGDYFKQLEIKDLFSELNEDEKEKIREIFNTLSSTDIGIIKERRHGPTAASKIMHIINPNLFVMWDKQIAYAYGCEQNAEGYLKFMEIMKKEAHELLESWKHDKSKDKLWQEFHNEERSITKIIDEFNWEITRKGYLMNLKKCGII